MAGDNCTQCGNSKVPNTQTHQNEADKSGASKDVRISVNEKKDEKRDSDYYDDEFK